MELCSQVVLRLMNHHLRNQEKDDESHRDPATSTRRFDKSSKAISLLFLPVSLSGCTTTATRHLF